MSFLDTPGHGSSDTSIAAAQSLDDEVLVKLRATIHAYIRSCPNGATCDEVEAALNMLHQTCSPRITELLRHSYLVISDQRRLTRQGRDARVYFARRPHPDEPRVTGGRYVCAGCGSTDVVCDALVEWSERRQRWVFIELQGWTWCNGCDKETTLRRIAVEVPV